MFIYTICMQKPAQLSSQNVMLLPESDSNSNEVRVTFFPTHGSRLFFIMVLLWSMKLEC